MLTIPFHKNLYTPEHLESAIEQFKDLGSLSLTSRGKYHHVRIDHTDQIEDLDRFVNEFKNYVLYLEISHATI